MNRPFAAVLDRATGQVQLIALLTPAQAIALQLDLQQAHIETLRVRLDRPDAPRQRVAR